MEYGGSSNERNDGGFMIVRCLACGKVMIADDKHPGFQICGCKNDTMVDWCDEYLYRLGRGKERCFSEATSKEDACLNPPSRKMAFRSLLQG